jgi:hypothetical protein
VSSFANEVTVCTPDKIKFGTEDAKGGRGDGASTIDPTYRKKMADNYTKLLLLLLLFDFSAPGI